MCKILVTRSALRAVHPVHSRHADDLIFEISLVLDGSMGRGFLVSFHC